MPPNWPRRRAPAPARDQRAVHRPASRSQTHLVPGKHRLPALDEAPSHRILELCLGERIVVEQVRDVAVRLCQNGPQSCARQLREELIHLRLLAARAGARQRVLHPIQGEARVRTTYPNGTLDARDEHAKALHHRCNLCKIALCKACAEHLLRGEFGQYPFGVVGRDREDVEVDLLVGRGGGGRGRGCQLAHEHSQ
jgi:hypothetical protein